MEPLLHFKELRRRIKARLEKPGTYAPYATQQIECYPWLYGALGNHEADVMFICENPSLTGVVQAHQNPPMRPPDIEAQWWGGKARLFRKVLCDIGLKSGAPAGKGGWYCYITNVIKAMAEVEEFNQESARKKADLAREWAKILGWELSQVDPKVVFCVGRKSEWAVRLLWKERLIRYDGPLRYVLHYSARFAPAEVTRRMRERIETSCAEAGVSLSADP